MIDSRLCENQENYKKQFFFVTFLHFELYS